MTGGRRTPRRGGGSSSPEAGIFYTIKIDGTDRQQITDASTSDAGGDVSYGPSGRKIVYSAETDGDLEIYTIRADGKAEEGRLTDNRAFQDDAPAYSPNGKWIVYHAYNWRTSDDWDIYRIRPHGGRRHQVTDNALDDRTPDWGVQVHP